MNTVILRGNLGQTPQLRQVGSGKSVLNFMLAVDKPDDNGTSWIPIVVWGNKAEHQARHLTKGSQVLVKGELNQRNWTDRDNQSRQSIEVIAQEIEWISLKEEPLS